MSVVEEIIDAFSQADSSDMPPLAELDDRLRIFWVLRLAQDELGKTSMTPAEISVVLRDVHGYDIPRQRIEGVLGSEKGTVARRKLGGLRAYQLMNPGRDELDSSKVSAVFINPAEGFKGLRVAHALLETLKGEIRVCDPYADARTLDMLALCQEASVIRLLTHKVQGPDGFKQAQQAFEREHKIGLDVRIAPKDVLHDRYAIHEDGMLLFGTSLNGLGLKQSFVIALGEDLRTATLAAFEATWDNSSGL